MPDVIEQLRSYGDAVEQAVEPVTEAVQRDRRPFLLVAAAVLVVLAGVAGAVWVLRAGGEDARPPFVSTVPDDGSSGWQALDAGPLSPREGAALVWTGEELVVWGGMEVSGGQPVPVGDGAAYDPATRTWRMLDDPPIGTAGVASGVWDGNEVVVWSSDPAEDPGYWTGGAWNPATGGWRRLATPSRPSIAPADLVWTGDEVVSIDIGAAYDPAEDAWRRLPLRPDPNQVQDVVWTGDEVVAIADNGVAVVAYSPDTDAWRTLPRPELDNMVSVRLAWVDDHLLAVTHHGDAASLTPGDAAWTEVARLPFMDSEGSVELATLANGRVVATDDSGYGVLGANGEWSIGPPVPHVVGTLVPAGDRVLAWWSSDDSVNFGPDARTWFQQLDSPGTSVNRALATTVPLGSVLLDLPPGAQLRAINSPRGEGLPGTPSIVASFLLGDDACSLIVNFTEAPNTVRATARDAGVAVGTIDLPYDAETPFEGAFARLPAVSGVSEPLIQVATADFELLDIHCPTLALADSFLAGIHR